MARIDNLTNFLTDVATSIRTKKGTTNKIAPKDFDTEIESIQSGGGTPNLQEKSVTITENTTTEIIADSDYDGLSKVSVLTNVTGSSDEPTKGIQIIDSDEEGYPTIIKCYGTTLPKYQFYNSSSSYSVPPTTVNSSNNGFIGKLNEIQFNTIKHLSTYALYCIHPSILDLSKIESVDNNGLYLRGGLKKFCLPNIRELGSRAIVDNYNNYYVWLGSSIFNNDYDSWTNEQLWVPHYWTIENGTLVDTGKTSTDNIDYIAATYNKIFDVSEYVGRIIEFRYNIPVTPQRPSYTLYDENYNIVKETEVMSGLLRISILSDAKYLVVHGYSASASITNNNIAKVTLKPQPFATNTTYSTNLHIANASFLSSKLQKLYIDLPRATVEASSEYTNGFQGSNTDEARAKIVCNDDDGFLTQEQFKAMEV